jgi:hypothetical protein
VADAEVVKAAIDAVARQAIANAAHELFPDRAVSSDGE